MEKKISPFAFVCTALLTLLMLLGASILLPHDRYHRFQAHHDGTTRKADWIFERLHFDDTPIDVALIGTSRMAGGLSGPLIEQEYCNATGVKIHVANLAIPRTGRNMHYVIAKETARMKAPALTIIELNEFESRRPHDGFIFLADASDIISAPLWINLNYLSDLLRLPGRQATLFVQGLTGRPAIRARFDRQDYAGPHLDRTETITAIDGRIKSRRYTHDDATMKAMGQARMAGIAPYFVLPKPLDKLEYRFSRHYLKKAETVMARAGSRTLYAYMPAFGASPPPDRLLAALNVKAPVISMGEDLSANPSQWLDATHLNTDGALLASKRFALSLAVRYPSLGAQACR